MWRRTAKGRIKVLVVHRPAYDDWSLPKGKIERGEGWRACALREVEEETGLRCRAGSELPETRYVDHKGRTKRVRYWAMEALAGDFTPNREVDEVRWLRLERAGGLLSYERDAEVVAALPAKASETARKRERRGKGRR